MKIISIKQLFHMKRMFITFTMVILRSRMSGNLIKTKERSAYQNIGLLNSTRFGWSTTASTIQKGNISYLISLSISTMSHLSRQTQEQSGFCAKNIYIQRVRTSINVRLLLELVVILDFFCYVQRIRDSLSLLTGWIWSMFEIWWFFIDTLPSLDDYAVFDDSTWCWHRTRSWFGAMPQTAQLKS